MGRTSPSVKPGTMSLWLEDEKDELHFVPPGSPARQRGQSPVFFTRSLRTEVLETRKLVFAILIKDKMVAFL
jgi:hypothetical protein